jgi:hypothetical protein
VGRHRLQRTGRFAFAQVLWLMLARDLPAIASTLSVMFIAVLGVFGGAVGWAGHCAGKTG